MFISNFAEEIGNAMRQYDEDMAMLSFAMEKIGITEEKLGIAEQRVRKAVLALKKMGLSLEEISRKLGCPQEAIENIV